VVNLIAVLIGIFGVIVMVVGFSLLMAIPTMLCWNHAVVVIWHLPAITFMQALCLNILASSFFKSSLSTSK
jgi:uncharacterized membrane protein